MFARRPSFPSGGRKGLSLQLAWILATAYLCGMLTVPLITMSTNLARSPDGSGKGGGESGAGVVRSGMTNVVEQEAQVDSSQRITESTSIGNPTGRRPKEQQRLPFNPDLALPGKRPTHFYDFKIECKDPVADAWSHVIDNIFDGASPYEHFPPDWASPYLHASKVKGWGSRGKVFERLMVEVRPQVVIELGAFLGASTIHLANLSRGLGLHTTIFAVDDFRGWAGFRKQLSNLKIGQINADVLLLHQFMRNVASEGFQDTILPIPFATSAALRAFCDWGIQADLIEVDAGHDFHSAWIDINRAFKVLKPGGVMFGHDYRNKYDDMGVGRAVDLFARTYGFTVEPDVQHWILRGTP